MRHRSALSVTLIPALAGWLAMTPVALAASAVQAPASPPPVGPTAPPVAPTPPAEAQRDLLRRDFDAFSAYLAKKGTVTADDRATAAALAARARTALGEKNDPLLWAFLAQAGLWTDDAALQDEAFAQVLKAQSTNEIAMAQWIAALNRRAAFERAIDETSSRFSSLSNFPRVQVAMAESLLGLNRFADARAVLESVTSPPPDLAARAPQLLERAKTLEALWAEEERLRAEDESKGENARVELVTSKGPILVELFETQAPQASMAFVEFVEGGTYAGTHVHRRIPGFAVLGGDPNSKAAGGGPVGWGSVGWRVPEEAPELARRTAFAGTLGLCKAADPGAPGSFLPGSAGPQFFVLLTPAEFLTNDPLAFRTFGRIIEGLGVAASLQPGDEILSTRVLRKGQHEYKATRGPELTQPAEMTVPASPPRPAAPRGTLTPGQGAPPIIPSSPPPGR